MMAEVHSSSEIVQDLSMNATESMESDLPIDMQFNEGHVVSIVTYGVLMVISAIGNITVLMLILRRKSSKMSRINIMLMHLAIADLLVRCGAIWISCNRMIFARNQFNFQCELFPMWLFSFCLFRYHMQLGHVFNDASGDRLGNHRIVESRRPHVPNHGFFSYLWNFFVVVYFDVHQYWQVLDAFSISFYRFEIASEQIFIELLELWCFVISRYYAVLRPLQLIGIDKRGKFMILGAWIFSIICSMPQVFFQMSKKKHYFVLKVWCITNCGFTIADFRFSRGKTSEVYVVRTVHYFQQFFKLFTRAIVFSIRDGGNVLGPSYRHHLYLHEHPDGNL